MLLPYFPSLLQSAYLCAACVGSYWLYSELTTGRRRRQLIKKHACKPVHKIKTWVPILGLDAIYAFVLWIRQHTLRENISKHLFGFGKKTVEIRLLGVRNICTMEAENVKAVLSLDFKSFGQINGEKQVDLLIGGGIFTNDGEAWHQSRELLRPSFARSQIADLAMLEKHVGNLVDMLPRDGSTINLSKNFAKLTLNIGIEFIFGDHETDARPHSPSVDLEKFTQAWNDISKQIVGEGGARSWLWRFLLDLFRIDPEFRRNCNVLHETVTKLVDQCLSTKEPVNATNTSRYSFLQELASQTTDRKRIRSEALSVLFASRDTTTALLTNVFFELSKRPDVWARLQQEISDALHGRRPTYEELKNLKYLRAVLNESQRLYPVVPEGGRRALANTVLPRGGGKDEKSPVFVGKGDIVLLGIHDMQVWQGSYGDDAGVFRPERWLDTEEKRGLRMGWEYLPFSGGPRACPGQNFALTEVSYTTIRIMQAFSRIESRDPNPWQEHRTLVCTSYGGCKVALFPSGSEETESIE